MLQSLEIRNYRNLSVLKLEDLGQVNLITGKNNTGKSTILEAISIFSSKGDLSWIYQILEERGETIRRNQTTKNPIENNVKTFSSLFTGRKPTFSIKDAIYIGLLEDTLFGRQPSSSNFTSFRLVKYVDELIENEEDSDRLLRRKRTIIENDSNKLIDYQVGLETNINGSTIIIPFNEDRPYRLGFRNIYPSDNFQYIKTRNLDREINGKLWDNIALSRKEDYVIQALKIIEPQLERIAFVINEDLPRQRTVVIKLSNSDSVIPLKSMGDGLNRILTIILAIVNCDNGFLLIDEFENGLHYSVQESLWKIIFRIAKELGVQIFATTHSQDCISTFENVLNDSNTGISGKLVRLENKRGVIRTVEFDSRDLRIATDNDIETR